MKNHRVIWEYLPIPTLPYCLNVKVNPVKHIYSTIKGALFTHLNEKFVYSDVLCAGDSFKFS